MADMSEAKPPLKAPSGLKPSPRSARQAEALKANLKRRKTAQKQADKH